MGKPFMAEKGRILYCLSSRAETVTPAEYLPNMLHRPSFVLRVVAPVIGPIVAPEHGFIVVWPGHPTHTLTSYDAGKHIVANKYVPDGALYGVLLILCADGILEPMTRADARRLRAA